eukprot:scaffold138736_cov38-Prasinocladus_malaysianus.AAC.1
MESVLPCLDGHSAEPMQNPDYRTSQNIEKCTAAMARTVPDALQTVFDYLREAIREMDTTALFCGQFSLGEGWAVKWVFELANGQWHDY